MTTTTVNTVVEALALQTELRKATTAPITIKRTVDGKFAVVVHTKD